MMAMRDFSQFHGLACAPEMGGRIKWGKTVGSKRRSSFVHGLSKSSQNPGQCVGRCHAGFAQPGAASAKKWRPHPSAAPHGAGVTA